MSASLHAWLQRAWYEKASGRWLLAPLSLLYAGVIALRRTAYRRGWLGSRRMSVPVVVVGNLVAGGAGKTPVTLFLAEALKARGFKPGIVSRGYGGKGGALPRAVTPDAAAADVGDEPLLLARRTGCPVVVGSDRSEAARQLVSGGVDVVLADDGLQHYRLERDFEVCVVDAERGFGNGCLLPAGPLREPLSRLAAVDAVVLNGRAGSDHASLRQVAADSPRFTLAARRAERVDGTESRPLAEFAGRAVHAVAGIGNPARFFRLLKSHGLTVVEHPLPDHAPLSEAVIDELLPAQEKDRDVLMTEKDAVKLAGTHNARLWFVPVDFVIEPPVAEALVTKIVEACGQRQGRNV